MLAEIYGPAVLPLVIIYCITSIETVGDVTATEEASFIATLGPKHEKRIRGEKGSGVPYTSWCMSGCIASSATC